VEQKTQQRRSSSKTSTSRQNSVRCGVPYSRLRAAAVRRDGRRRREGGPRLPRGGHAYRRCHVVRRHVVHGARSARRHRMLLPGYRGERCLAAAHARPLIRPEDALRQAVCAAGTSRSARRDAIQRDALLARPDVERRSGDRGLRIERPEHLSPTWTRVARVRPQTDANLAERSDYQFHVCVENVEICQTDGYQIVFTADG